MEQMTNQMNESKNELINEPPKGLLVMEHVTGTDKKSFSLKDISFELPAGYIMGLAGENGAGKTTLFDYIMNPRKRYEGTIYLEGKDIRTNHTYIKNKIGFVSENNVFFEEMTAGVNGKMAACFYEEWDQPLFEKTMKEMQLPLGKCPGKMSRGEKIKFQTAFAMAHHPVLYLLDEVTAGMDPVFRVDYFKILQRLIADEKTSIIMTSHIKEEMERKMDYRGIMEKGVLKSFEEC